MFELDHVAVQTTDVVASIEYYVQNFNAQVLYADSTWALLKVGQGKLALVTPSQHPSHLAFRVDEAVLAREAKRAGKSVDRHRDGTTGIYVDDPAGNTIELICYPPGETVYEK